MVPELTNADAVPLPLAAGPTECPPVGELVRLAEEGGRLHVDRCGCDRCFTVLADAVSTAAFARKVRGESPRPLCADSISGLRLRMDAPLGSGGQAAVYFGVDLESAACVAVKVLSEDRCVRSDLVVGLFAEGLWLRQLASPGIVGVHSCGVTRNGLPYLATQYIEGPTLQDMLPHRAERGTSAHDRVLWALRVVADILAPLAVMHARGIVHRDLKPANVLMLHGRQPILVDLGIAVSSVASEVPQATDTFTGSRAYAAPERLRLGDAVRDPRIDVYSVGVMLRELAEPDGERRVIGQRLSAGLREVITRATTERMDDRYSDAMAMLEDVAALRAWEQRRRRRPVLTLAAVGVVCVGVGAMSVVAARPDAVGASLTPAPASRPAPGRVLSGAPSALIAVPAFSPRDRLIELRSNWQRSGLDVPDLVGASESLDAAQTYFGAIEPLTSWGYLGGDTVEGQINAVATQPLEVFCRGGRSLVIVRQPDSGLVRTIEWGEEPFPRVSLSPDGSRVLLFGFGRNFAVYDRATLRQTWSGKLPIDAVTEPVIADDGRHVARVDVHGRAWLRRIDGGWEQCFPQVGPIIACVFSGDRLLGMATSGVVVSTQLATGQTTVASPATEASRVQRIACDRGAVSLLYENGQSAISRDHGLTWYPLIPYAQGRDHLVLATQHGEPRVMAFSWGVGRWLNDDERRSVTSGFVRVIKSAIADDQRVLVTHGRTWRLLRFMNPSPWFFPSVGAPGDMFMQRVDDHRFVGGVSGLWRIDAYTGDRIQFTLSPLANVSLDAASGRALIGAYHGRFELLDTNTNTPIWSRTLESLGSVNAALRGDLCVVGGDDGSVIALNANTGDQRWTRKDHRFRIRGISIGGGAVATSSASPGIVVYDANGAKKWICRIADARCVAITNDAALAFGGTDRGSVLVANESSSTPIIQVNAHAGSVWSVAINDAGTIAASGGGDGIVRLWWLRPLTPLASFEVDAQRARPIYDVRFSSGGDRLTGMIADAGPFEIDLRQWERPLEDWLVNDHAFASPNRRATTTGDDDDTSTADGAIVPQ